MGYENTVPGILARRAAHSGKDIAQWSRAGSGSWVSGTYDEYVRDVSSVAYHLQRLGLKPGDRVGIMAASSRYWDVMQQAIMAAGGVVVGLDLHDLDSNLNRVAEFCRLSALVVGDQESISRFEESVQSKLKYIICSNRSNENGDVVGFQSLLDTPYSGGDCGWIQADPDQPATILFTSGTTGTPKGIQYTHRQICLAAASVLKAFPNVGADAHLVCWLPLSNMFQRMINILSISAGARLFYVEQPTEIMQHVKQINPHVFIGVPRFYEKLYAGMMQAGQEASPAKRRLINWAMERGDRFASAQRNGDRLNLLSKLQWQLSDYLVLRKFREVLGCNLKYMISGSAPMPSWLLERFHGMGLLVLEAYGMSENVVPVAANRPDSFKFGTVGRVMEGCSVQLADDGELLVRGEGVISSYLGDDGVLLDKNGFLSTGDFADIDGDGFITLTGRKSEIFKTATGRRIAPVGIESVLKEMPGIEYAAVFGAGRSMLVAVVSVPAELLNKADVRSGDQCQLSGESLLSGLHESLSSLAGYKRPAGLVITSRPFSIEGGELTTNLKMRRKIIAEKYAEDIEALYRFIGAAKDSADEYEVDPYKGEIRLCRIQESIS